MKKSYIFALLIISTTLISCIKDLEEPYCECTNPLKEIEWLKEKYEGALSFPNDKTQINMVTYKGNQGFLIFPYENYPDAVSNYYDCSGNLICTWGGWQGYNTCPDFNDNVTFDELLWKNNN